jgi:hypothetical protein
MGLVDLELLPVHVLKIRALNHRSKDLTTAELKFLIDLCESRLITEEQIKKLEEVYEGIRNGRQFHFGDIEETWRDVPCLSTTRK